MALESACLGLEILGGCNYDPSDPPRVYFSIGQLISVIALALVFYQLIKPIIRFRIQVSKINENFLICVFILAIGSVFLASILPFSPWPALPLVGYPIFWEFISGLLIVLVAFDIFLVVVKKGVFRKEKAQDYLDACATIIARGNDDDLRELANEISASIEPIFKECSAFDESKAYRAKEEQGDAYQVSESANTAFAILELWSDKALCKNIACKAPATALKIFDQLVNSPRSHAGYALSQEILHQSFVNRDSLLMREVDYSGLGYFKQFRDKVFGEELFINSNYRPLQAWKYYEEAEPWQAEKYCECLEASFTAYFKAKDYGQFPAALSVGLDHLASIAGSQVAHVRYLNEQESYRSKEFKILHEIGHGFEKIVDIVEKYQDHIPEYEFDEKKYDRFKDNSIYGVVAYGIYDFFESLATTQGHDTAIRQCAIGLWLRVFGVEASKMTTAQDEIGKRLILHLKNKVDQNLDPDQRWYPAITRLLISLNGIYESKETGGKRIGNQFHREFIQRLKQGYLALVQRDPEFAEHMLPDDVEYDGGKNELRRKGLRQKEYVLKLIPPQ